MNIHEIKCFQIVYRERSLNRAAKKLYITSQGLGRIVQNLEQELGVRLFDRSTRGVDPTEAADVLYENAARLVEDFERVDRAIRQLGERDRKLRICCARGVLNALSFHFLLGFIENNPDLEVSWEEAANQEVKNAVISMESDVGLTVGHTESNETEEYFLASREVRILVYEGHPYYQRDRLALEELAGERILILDRQYQVYHDFTDACRTARIKPEIAGTTEDSHFLYKLCKDRQGLGVLLDFSMDAFNQDSVRQIPLVEPITWDIYLIYRKNRADYPNVNRFIGYCKDR